MFAILRAKLLTVVSLGLSTVALLPSVGWAGTISTTYEKHAKEWFWDTGGLHTRLVNQTNQSNGSLGFADAGFPLYLDVGATIPGPLDTYDNYIIQNGPNPNPGFWIQPTVTFTATTQGETPPTQLHVTLYVSASGPTAYSSQVKVNDGGYVAADVPGSPDPITTSTSNGYYNVTQTGTHTENVSSWTLISPGVWRATLSKRQLLAKSYGYERASLSVSVSL